MTQRSHDSIQISPVDTRLFVTQAALATATCDSVSRLATCTNHLFAKFRPDPAGSGSLSTTCKNGDDGTTKPPAIARFPLSEGVPPGRQATVVGR